MLMQINIFIQDITLDLILAYCFSYPGFDWDPTQGLDEALIMAETKCSINFSNK